MWQAEVCFPGVPLPKWNSAHGPESLLGDSWGERRLEGFQADTGCQGNSVDAVVEDDCKLTFFRE